MSTLASNWHLDPNITFLNHGSFGACPSSILTHQNELQRRMETQPVKFFVRDLAELASHARESLANFVGSKAEDLALIPNATTAINAVLRSMSLAAGDEILLTNHSYNACKNAVIFVTERVGARAVVVDVPFPIESPQQVIDTVLAHVTPRTRLAMLDHITSPTALVFPIKDLVEQLDHRGVDTLVDGAHAPGMVPLNLSELGAAYYTGNCHKWMCAPKGAAFLHVREDKQAHTRPLTISHGANEWDEHITRFRSEFDWLGTDDPTAHLTIPHAITAMEKIFGDSWNNLRERNHQLAIHAQQALSEALDIPAACPTSMLGSMAAVPLMDDVLQGSGIIDELQDILMSEYDIEVPVSPKPRAPIRTLRVSCQLYNEPEHYDALKQALIEIQKRHNIRLGIQHGRV